ncbi:hypothetical protein A2U01_0102066, partial [Trifolium medium]|nr:hypothetical protein [Trifolium medium]
METYLVSAEHERKMRNSRKSHRERESGPAGRGGGNGESLLRRKFQCGD